jgi:GT2 family glycosyltransferase
LSTTAPQTRHTVTAIIVAHDGARLLPGLVQAIKAQTYPVDQSVGVDTASRDRSGSVLAELIGQDAVFGMDRSTGYGEAVSVALQHATRRQSGRTDPNLKRVEWIWLLHDDCEPAPESLERLLRAASKDRSVAVLGPKVLDGQDRRTLREAGVSIDRAGRRITGIEPGEIDQGQHDHNRDVLAVGSAGMLVRRDVWDQLGGFDTGFRLFRDDLDFCWRVQAAGYRVQVVTDAVLYHRELSARRRRPIDGGNARWLDRHNALFVLAINLPLLTMLRVLGGCIVGSLVRASYFLVTKQLDLAAAQAFGVTGLLGHPIRLLRGRRRRARGRAEAYSAVRQLIPPARTLFRLAEDISGLVTHGPPQASSGQHQAVSEDQEDEQFVDTQSMARQIIGNPGVQLFVALLLIALIAERRLLGVSPLGGGALVPAWGGAPALWREYLAGFHTVGLGSTASAPPYLAIVAALGTVLGGQAWLAVDVLLLGCVPLAGLTAYLATRRLVAATAARLLLAASYALLPVATGAVAAGRLGTAVAFVQLPLIAVSAGRMLTAAPRQARRAAWAVGLLVAVAAAFAPLAWVLGVVFAVGAVAARRWLLSANPVNAAIVAVVPFFVLFPWSLHLLASPSSLIAEAGVPAAGLTTVGLGPSELLALSPGGPGLPPVWVTVGFVLAVLAVLLPHRGRDLTIVGWIVAIVGFLAAVVVRTISLTPSGGGQAVAGWPGFALALAALGLLLAMAPAAQWLAEIIKNSRIIPNGPGRLPDPSPEPAAEPASGLGYGIARRALACAVLVGAATAPLLVAGYWVKAGVQGPIGNVSAPLLPAFVSASSTSGEQYRTLILRPNASALDSGALVNSALDNNALDNNGLTYTVVRQGDPTLGEPELASAPAAEQSLTAEVAALGAPNGADAGDPGLALGEYGIKWVLLPGPVDQAVAQQLDAAAGLVAMSKAPTYDLWQVAGPVARVRAVAADGTTTTLDSGPVDLSGVSAPAAGGTLVLAEPYGGWTAALNGSALKPLAAPVDGWAQGFVLPAGGGHLSITRNNLARDVSLIAELIAVLAICVLALPGKRADPAEEAQALEALREARHSRRTAEATGARARAGDLGRVSLSLGAGLAAPYRAMSHRPRLRRPMAGKRGKGQDPELDYAELPGTGFPDPEFPAEEFEDAEFHKAAAADDALAAVGPPGNGAADGRWDMAADSAGATPWETGPEERPPWETDSDSWGTGPQATVSSTGSQRSMSWGTGPQHLDSRESGSQVPADSTGPQRSASSWETGPQRRDSWDTGLDSRESGSRVPADSTGPQRSAPWETDPQRRDSWDTGSNSWGTGPQATVSSTGSQRSLPWGTGPQAPVQPADREPAATPWDQGDWAAPASWPGDPDLAAGPERDDAPERLGTGGWEVPARADVPASVSREAVSREAKPERHSHRAAKHGRPGRWRGGADRSGRDKES